MTTQTATLKPQLPKVGIVKGLLLTLPIALLSALMLTGGKPAADPLQLVATAITWLVLSAFFFLMLTTGQTYRYRSILFITMALAMVVWFMVEVFTTRGSNVLKEVNVIQGETPFCHLVIPMVIVPALLTRTIIFPGSLTTGFAPIAGMIVLWLGSSLALGRGFCSWVCFYGGWDEGFSRLLKKPRLKTIDRKWTYLPWAMLLFIVLTSAVTLSPIYCAWFCPFKTVTEYGAITSITAVVQTVIFVSLFAGLVVILPLLTKRRTQCGLFCPFGAMQSLTNKVNIFDVRIDTAKCTQCGLCVKNCPTFSLSEESVKQGRTLMSCTKCGQCMDACPKKAIAFHIKGTRPGLSPNAARILFLYPAFLVFAAMGGGMIVSALWRILKLVTTGSLI
jgi:Pyruvate/2-oxoacid:ferredoxin oxidoreductase delta subunit